MKFITSILSAAALCAFGVSTQAHQPEMNSKTAHYHQHGKPPIELQVLKVHPDKTVDLGDAAGNLIVGKCESGSEARVGCCTPVAAKPDVKALKARAGELSDLAKKAADAAEKAKGKPNEAELASAATAATEAANAAAKEVETATA